MAEDAGCLLLDIEESIRSSLEKLWRSVFYMIQHIDIYIYIYIYMTSGRSIDAGRRQEGGEAAGGEGG